MSLVSVLVSLLLVTIVEESVAVRKDRKLEVIPQKCNTVENLSGYCGQPFDCEDALDEWEAQDVEPNFCHYVNDNDFTICCPRKSEFHCEYTAGTELSSNNDDPGEFSFIAAVGWTNLKGHTEWRCGGALISDRFVLTAAHCSSHRNIPPDLILVGDTNKHKSDGGATQSFAIEQTINHPLYRFRSQYNDIALIKLRKSAYGFRTVCLQTVDDASLSAGTVIGYFSEDGSDNLLKADVKIFENDQCKEYYDKTRTLRHGIIESQVCAGDKSGDNAGSDGACQGDSGGPLLSIQDGKNRIVGVASFGKGCETNTPIVFSRVSSYVEWIESVVWPKVI